MLWQGRLSKIFNCQSEFKHWSILGAPLSRLPLGFISFWRNFLGKRSRYTTHYGNSWIRHWQLVAHTIALFSLGYREMGYSWLVFSFRLDCCTRNVFHLKILFLTFETETEYFCLCYYNTTDRPQSYSSWSQSGEYWVVVLALVEFYPRFGFYWWIEFLV